MDVQAAIGGGRRLRRIMALLVSLAGLAERAASRSLPVRWLVLWLLRQAESVAEAFVFEETGLPLPPVEGFAAEGFGREDALHLAARFRALAAWLGALLAVACLFGRRPARQDIAFCSVAPGSGHLPGGRRPMPNDTS